MIPQPEHSEKALSQIVAQSDWFMSALRDVRALGLARWCIGAGAVRNVVWDYLHERLQPSALSDVDVAYFDASNLDQSQDHALQEQLRAGAPSIPWEVTNQASVHLWFESHFGHAVAPLTSLEEAVASWPEYATSVGVSLRTDDTLEIIAPLGLDDLFAMRIRRNPARVSKATYALRCQQKNYGLRWPLVSVVDCEA
jgi:uncharacterized protein